MSVARAQQRMIEWVLISLPCTGWVPWPRAYGASQGDEMKGLFTSRKFIVAVVSLGAMVLGAASGMDVTPDQVEVMTQLVCAWLIAQGIADNGAGGTTRSGE